jgi:hypothetical protein
MKKLLQAKTFIIPAMRAGLCQYEEERVLVKNEALAALSKTCYGIPLIMPEHVEVEELEQNLDKYLVGRVADMHYDDAKDVWLAHCVADTQEAVDLFEKGWGVSTSYVVESKGEGGTLNAVPYDAEVLTGKYLHLAIVEHPRYEMAKDPTFYNSADAPRQLTPEPAVDTIKNSESISGDKLMKFFRTKREEVKENSEGVEIEIDGEKVPLTNLVEAYKASKMNAEPPPPAQVPEEKPEEKTAEALPEEKPEDEKPAVENEEKDLDEEVKNLLASLETDEEKKNEEEPEEKKEEKDEKKNERFNSLKQKSEQTETLDNGLSGYKTLHELAAIGRQRYGK